MYQETNPAYIISYMPMKDIPCIKVANSLHVAKEENVRDILLEIQTTLKNIFSYYFIFIPIKVFIEPVFKDLYFLKCPCGLV